MEGNYKVAEPTKLKNVVPVDGPFHFHSHYMFGANEGFHEAYTCWAATQLRRNETNDQKINHIQQDLEHNACAQPSLCPLRPLCTPPCRLARFSLAAQWRTCTLHERYTHA